MLPNHNGHSPIWVEILELLQFGLRRRQFACGDRVLKPSTGMRSVAERLVGGLSAAAERDHGTAGKPEGGAGGVQNLEVALDSDRSVVQH